MTRVAWLADPGNLDGTLGGAELTMAEFAAAAPDYVEIVTDGLEGADTVVVGNCVSYAADTIKGLEGKRVVRYFNDLDPHSHPRLREWLLRNAVCVFTSPLHRDRFPWELPAGSHIIPPALNLDRFTKAAQRSQERAGAVALGPWMNPGKAPHLATEWAAGNGGIDFFGAGPFAPSGSVQVQYDEIPDLLARYKTLIHLPTAVEPFGRTVVEAWAAGCRVVTNGLVGARYWITKQPDKLETAAWDFWDVVLNS